MLDRPDAEGLPGDEGETPLGLDAVIASGWADPDSFPPAEYAKAAALYASMRQHDEHLLAIRQAVAAEIQGWTGRVPRDVGSFGLRLNLETSDLLSVLTEEDFKVACRMLDEIDQTMSKPERIAHTWVKYLLRRAGRLVDDPGSGSLVGAVRCRRGRPH